MKSFSEVPRLLAQAATDHSWWTGLLALGMGVLEYFAPGDVAKNMLLGLGVLMIADTLTGVRASVKTGGRITSQRFGGVLDKVLGYSSVIAVFAVVGRHVPGLEQFMGGGIASVLTLMITREAVSILENVVKIGIDLPFGLTEKLKEKLGQNNAMAANDGQEKKDQ